MQLGDLLLGDVDVGERGGDLLGGQRAPLLPLGDQRLEIRKLRTGPASSSSVCMVSQ